MIPILRRLAFRLDLDGTLTLTECTRLVQGSFGFVMLQIDAPLSQFDDTYPCIEMLVSRSITNQSGTLALHKGQKYGMVYVGKTQHNNQKYRRFERPLPKSFTEDTGSIQIVFEYRSVELEADSGGSIIKKTVKAQLSSQMCSLTVYPSFGAVGNEEVVSEGASFATRLNSNTAEIETLTKIVQSLPGGMPNAADIRITEENPNEGTIFLDIE